MKRKKSFKEWLEEKKAWCEENKEYIVGLITIGTFTGACVYLGTKAGYFKGSNDATAKMAAKIMKEGIDAYNEGIEEGKFQGKNGTLTAIVEASKNFIAEHPDYGKYKFIAEKIVKEDK